MDTAVLENALIRICLAFTRKPINRLNSWSSVNTKPNRNSTRNEATVW